MSTFKKLFTEAGDYSEETLIKRIRAGLDSVANGCGTGYKDMKDKNKKVTIIFKSENDAEDFENDLLSGDCKNARSLLKLVNQIGANVYLSGKSFVVSF